MQFMIFVAAGFLEIGGCYLVWLTVRQGHPWAIYGGLLLLILFGYVLAQASTSLPSRSYAAYGGVYITLALIWMITVEKIMPDRWDAIGSALCIIGAMVILLGPRG